MKNKIKQIITPNYTELLTVMNSMTSGEEFKYDINDLLEKDRTYKNMSRWGIRNIDTGELLAFYNIFQITKGLFIRDKI